MSQDDRPSILFVLTADHGYGDVFCAFVIPRGAS